MTATEPMMQFFAYDHLPEHLQAVSRPYGELAASVVETLPRNPERTAALRKLLESKDCAVRSPTLQGRLSMSDDLMKNLAGGINKILNGEAKAADRKNGFVLLTFPFNAPEGARTNYVSNANRDDIIVALKEIVARFEGRAHDTDAIQ